MNETTAQTVALLTAAYPRQEFPEDSMRLYVQMLADIPEPELAAAVTRLVRRSTWLPSIAEIRLEAAEAKLALPSAGAAWEQATGRGDMHPVVREAYDAAGGSWAFRTSEAPGVLRAQFTKDYLVRRQEALLVAAEAHPSPPVSIERSAVKALLPSEEEGWHVTQRHFARQNHEHSPSEWPAPGVPTEDEKRDAIVVLRRAGYQPGTVHLSPHPTWVEAHRILDEAGSA